MNNKWSWNKSEDGIWNNELFDTKREAIDCGIEESELDVFYIGQSKVVTPSGVDVEWILENVAENTIHKMCDDVGEDYLLHVATEHENILEERLNKVLFDWMKEFGYEPDFYTIGNIEEINR